MFWEVRGIKFYKETTKGIKGQWPEGLGFSIGEISVLNI